MTRAWTAGLMASALTAVVPDAASAAYVTSVVGEADAARIHVHGVFAIGVWDEQNPAGRWGEPAWGYVYFACEPGDGEPLAAACLADWSAVAASAGSGDCLGFGDWVGALVAMRAIEEAPVGPDA